LGKVARVRGPKLYFLHFDKSVTYFVRRGENDC
jgi:hypothetical protein